MNNKNDRIVEMLSNPYIKEFVDKYHIPTTTVANKYYIFSDCFESLTKCKNCKGLYTCKQDKQGEMMTLGYDGDVYNDITYCKYYVEKLKKEKQIKSFVRSDIPENYSEVFLDNIDIDDEGIANLSLICYDILDGQSEKGLYIYGDLGVGKTYMCIALANSLVKKGEKVAFIKSNYFINEMRKLNITDSEEYEKVIEAMKKVKYLFIDDIGSESVSAYSRDDVLFNILDYRMENKLCTIFTSNLSKEALLKHYTFDKNDNASTVKAKRLLERIDILSDNYVLQGPNKRRGQQV